MLKAKLLVGIATLVAAMLAMAAPAMAEFESTSAETHGPIVKFPEKSTFKSSVGGPTIECKSKTAGGEETAKGEWQIQGKATTQQGKYFFQAPATKGPHEQLKITKWGVCVGPTGIAATVQCNLQVENASRFGNTGSVYPPGCKVLLGSETGNFCQINVDANQNKELSEVKLANGGAGEVEIESNIKGITSFLQEKVAEGKGKCKELLVEASQGGGTFVTAGGALKTKGQKLV